MKKKQRRSLPEILFNKLGLLTRNQAIKHIKKFYTPSEDINLSGETGKESIFNITAYLQTFITNPWVYSATVAIAEAGAGVPYYLYRWDKKEQKEIPVEDHPAYDLLEKPNNFNSFYDLIEGSLIFLELTGKAFWQIDLEEGKKKPQSLYLLKPDKVRILPDPKKFIKGYIYKPGNRNISFSPEEIIFFRYFSPLSEYDGVSPISAARNSLILDAKAVKFNKDLLTKGIPSEVFLESEADLDPETIRRIQADFKRKYQGLNKDPIPPILSGGLKAKTITPTPRDMQFSTMKTKTKEEILATFKVPPIFVQQLEYSSYANAKEQTQIFWKANVLPKLKNLAEEITRCLIKRYYDNDLYFAFDYSKIEALQEDTKTQAETLKILVDAGIITPDEARRELNMEPSGLTKEISKEEINVSEMTRNEFAKYSLSKIDELEEKLRKKVAILMKNKSNEILKKFDQFDPENPVDIETFFFNEEIEEKEELNKFYEIFFRGAILEGGIQGAARARRIFNIDKVEDLNGWLSRVSEKESEALIGLIKRNTIFPINKGIDEKLSKIKIKENLKSHLESINSIQSVKLKEIGSTQAHMGFSKGVLEGFKQIKGSPGGKMWVSTFDTKTRGAHFEASGQIRDMDKPFNIGGEALDHPGDPKGSPAMICNCRCVMDIVSEDEYKRAEDEKSPDNISQPSEHLKKDYEGITLDYSSKETFEKNSGIVNSVLKEISPEDRARISSIHLIHNQKEFFSLTKYKPESKDIIFGLCPDRMEPYINLEVFKHNLPYKNVIPISSQKRVILGHEIFHTKFDYIPLKKLEKLKEHYKLFLKHPKDYSMFMRGESFEEFVCDSYGMSISKNLKMEKMLKNFKVKGVSLEKLIKDIS